jgi:hypothetical protein
VFDFHICWLLLLIAFPLQRDSGGRAARNPYFFGGLPFFRGLDTPLT